MEPFLLYNHFRFGGRSLVHHSLLEALTVIGALPQAAPLSSHLFSPCALFYSVGLADPWPTACLLSSLKCEQESHKARALLG